MDLLKPFKEVKKRLAKYKEDLDQEEEEIKKQEEDQKKLARWKTRLEDSLNAHSGFRYKAAEWDAQYHGSKSVKALTSNNFRGSSVDEDSEQTKKARQVVNITMQLIEAQINTDIPKPRVDCIEGNEDLEKRKMIEGMLSYMSGGTDIQKINSENERIVKKNGIAVFKVIYNPDKGGRSFRGKIEVVNPHPVNIVPQHGIYKIEDMDYLIHIENRTYAYIGRMYGEEYVDMLEGESAEYYYLEDLASGSTDKGNNTGMTSVIECWYKDKDGDIGLLAWSNDVILKDMPKFYYKRDENGEIIVEEEVVKKTIVQQQDPVTGQVVESLTEEPVMVEVRVPKTFPFVITYNIPIEKCYYGKSDPDIISDQQEGIKKMLSNEEERQLKGNTKIFVREGTGIKDRLTNAITQVIEVDDPQGDIHVVDLKTRDNDLVNLYQVYLQAAKDIVGVTEASQGRADSSTLSGKALETLAQNTQFRQSIKTFEKNIGYTKLYQLLYDFIIAFYDDKIPYRIENVANNEPEFGIFDKGMLIKQDAAGEWYYPEFDIYIEVDKGISKDKNFIMQVADKMLSSSTNADIDVLIDYWTIMSGIGVPCAQTILDNMKKRKQALEEQQAMQMQQQQEQEAINKQQQAEKQNIENSFKQKEIDLKNKAIDSKNGQATEEAQPQGDADNEKNIVAETISKLPPKLQQELFSASEEEQADMIDKILKGELK